jgi:hypothetical protein
MRAGHVRRTFTVRKGDLMKKKLVPILIALLVVAALALGSRVLRAGDKPGKKETPAPDVTLTGTVVDMHCYVTHGIHGGDHTGCANACIARGVPAGFLTEDGVLYVLFGETPHSVKETVKDMADVPAKATGTPAVRGGVRGLQLKSIEKKAVPAAK